MHLTKTWKPFAKRAHNVREICVQPQQDKERARHAKAIEPLDKRANDLRTKISTLTDERSQNRAKA